MTLHGAVSNLLTLASSSSPTRWGLTVNGSMSVDFVSVSDSDASGGTAITQTNSTDGGHNLNWVFNTAPSFSAGPSDGGSVAATPTNVGSNVAFTATATDTQSDNYYLAICKTNSVTANNSAAPTCGGGNWCISGSTAAGSQASCNYTTLSGDVESNAWFAFVCDNNSSSMCSTSSQGSGNNGSPFAVNHAPTFSAITNTAGYINAGNAVTFNTTASDADTSDTVTLYVCKANDFSAGACGSGGEWCHSSAASSNPSCSYTVVSGDGDGSHTYYGNIIDSHSFGSASNSRSSTFNTDVTKPTTSDDYAHDNVWVNSNQTITLTPTDATSGIASTKYCTDSTNTCDPTTGTSYTTAVSFSTEAITYFRYESTDNAGNVQTTVSRAVKIDKTPPLVNAGTDQNKSAQFTQSSTDSDALSGILSYLWTKVSGSGNITFGTAALSDTTISADANDTYVIRMTVTDNAGNTASDDFTLVWSGVGGGGGGGLPSVAYDKPLGPFLVAINNGQALTNSRDVVLHLGAGSNVTRMAISNDSNFTNAFQEPYQTTKNWTLTDGQGTKTVYAKFYTSYGTPSEAVSDSIEYSTKQNIIQQIIQPIATIGQQIGNIFNPNPVVIVPPIPITTPEAFKDWNLMTTKPIGSLNISSVPSDISFFAGKFIQFNQFLRDVGVNKISDLSKLNTVQLTLPGFTQMSLVNPNMTPKELATLQGLPLSQITAAAAAKIPDEVLFAKTGNGLIDINTHLSFDVKGNASQKIDVVVNKPLELLIKPSAPVKSITGFVVLASKVTAKQSWQDLQQQKNISPLTSLKFNDFLASLVPVALAAAVPLAPPTSPEMPTQLLLQKFQYTQAEKGFYVADFTAPAVEGSYEIITLIDYQDPNLAPKQIKLVTVVDPEGYIYEQIGNLQARIPGAVVSMYWLNPNTKNYELWPAEKYLQHNPVITDSTGKYSFLTPEGTYYLEVKAPGYPDYKGSPLLREAKACLSILN
jgi:hypothetical protein